MEALKAVKAGGFGITGDTHGTGLDGGFPGADASTLSGNVKAASAQLIHPSGNENGWTHQQGDPIGVRGVFQQSDNQ